MHLPDSAILNNLYVPGVTRPDTIFEKRYIDCRSMEERMYTDTELPQLPYCSPSHIHYHEWVLRSASFKKLYTYLEQKKKLLSVLDIGCGNGWLCNRLSFLPRIKITGLDINFTELQQAARVFNTNRKLSFVYGDIRSGILSENKYNIILFSASIQYFNSIDIILECCLEHLAPGGEIHIMDTMFYKPTETNAAQKRTSEYYRSLGMPEMGEHYFHHSLKSLSHFNHSILYNPSLFINRLKRPHSPFHWIRIVKDRE